MTDDQMISDIREELKRARASFPGNKYTNTALQEEVGELAKALLEHQNGLCLNEDVYREAVQVAAMAIRVAVEGDHTFRYDPNTL